MFTVILFQRAYVGAPPWSSGSLLDHRSLPPVFESRRGHIWRLFGLSRRLITFEGRSAHLAYLVHKNGRKTTIIIINHHHEHIVPAECACRIKSHTEATPPEVYLMGNLLYPWLRLGIYTVDPFGIRIYNVVNYTSLAGHMMISFVPHCDPIP